MSITNYNFPVLSAVAKNVLSIDYKIHNQPFVSKPCMNAVTCK